MTQRITLRTVLEHIQSLKTDLTGKIDTLDRKLSARIDMLDLKIDKTETRLVRMIDGLDDRLNSIEITLRDQDHERRIQALEQHAGLAA